MGGEGGACVKNGRGDGVPSFHCQVSSVSTLRAGPQSLDCVSGAMPPASGAIRVCCSEPSLGGRGPSVESRGLSRRPTQGPMQRRLVKDIPGLGPCACPCRRGFPPRRARPKPVEGGPMAPRAIRRLIHSRPVCAPDPAHRLQASRRQTRPKPLEGGPRGPARSAR